ncbi:hypothetical protein HMPREF9103_02222 [Lentilactobacillus parafarraginis F0439]|uniref:Uncharacterized protein n=1 Tax=Lentilactobacillus parafarraginis F0439 TaxID=797515 RepID=G9ZR61_9LACO|nr:hypothetical protein HMPREF9103_02222 [Lentilactobacillus parafarraginis F0439]
MIVNWGISIIVLAEGNRQPIASHQCGRCLSMKVPNNRTVAIELKK